MISDAISVTKAVLFFQSERRTAVSHLMVLGGWKDLSSHHGYRMISVRSLKSHQFTPGWNSQHPIFPSPFSLDGSLQGETGENTVQFVGVHV